MFYRAGEGGKIAARRSVYTAVRLPLRCTTVCSTTPTSTHQNSALSLPPAAPDTSIDPTGHHLMLLSALLTTTAAIMSSVPKLTLTYFDFEGPTAAVRMALHMSELEWEDKRITHDEFVALKPTLPNNQIPILEIDGRVLPQRGAQLRYVGKLAGLYPTDPVEAAFADAAVESVGDNHLKLRPTMLESDPVKQAAMRKDFSENFLPTWMTNVEKSLQLAGGNYFSGNKLSIGDLEVVSRLLWLKSGKLSGVPSTCVDGHPLLCALIDRVAAEPKLASYMTRLTK